MIHKHSMNTKKCKCICDKDNEFLGVHRLKEHMKSEYCKLNLANHKSSINKICESVKNILSELASDQTSINQINTQYKKMDVLDCPQIDKKIID